MYWINATGDRRWRLAPVGPGETSAGVHILAAGIKTFLTARYATIQVL